MGNHSLSVQRIENNMKSLILFLACLCLFLASLRQLPSTLLVLSTMETSPEFLTSTSRLEGELENIFLIKHFRKISGQDSPPSPSPSVVARQERPARRNIIGLQH